MLDHLRDLLSHCAWADAVFFHAWSKSDREDVELRERVNHSSGTQSLFIQTLRGDESLPWAAILKGDVKPPWADKPLPGFDDLEAASRRNHGDFRALLERLDVTIIAKRVTIPWFPEPPCVVTTGEALVQVAMHTQHHRGQNMSRLKAIGGKPSNVDYIVWLWKGRPAPRFRDLPETRKETDA